ncbi:RrF2 family transcriptional regulator [Paracraurococcus lichenis]|uniref:Rrf2 family transcriptional regulator n=1 Tax=Paracraurococcus lichenis TaxID=3064888 RepID=A0ABT9E897_9PROT|nr:Rrf2 family transcriptional regulator [Paracraurococcus sp. LOR1-02]MDO9712431.1 Rrf2 family transcriptional regulator [Paracraurococcus sp. LOR1-02]
MRLTLHTDLAFRTLMHLALRPGARVQTEEIATAWRISANHLDKVVQRLAAAGFIETRRGRGGGMVLAMAPEAIRLGDVVRRTEDDLALVACFSPGGDPCGDVSGERCVLAGACRLQGALGRAMAAFLGVLDGMTLADLLDRPARAAAEARLGLASLSEM